MSSISSLGSGVLDSSVTGFKHGLQETDDVKTPTVVDAQVVSSASAAEACSTAPNCTPASKWAHLSASVDFSDGRETKTTTPEVRKPFAQRHFMIHPTWMVQHVPILKDETDFGQIYVLTPEVSAMLPSGDRKFATIYVAVTSDDIVFFHFRRESANEENIWARTALDTVALGRSGWIRTTNAPGGGYDIHHASDPTFCSKLPAWPADIDRAFDIALNGATGEGGQLITSPKHRVIAALLRRAQ